MADRTVLDTRMRSRQLVIGFVIAGAVALAGCGAGVIGATSVPGGGFSDSGVQNPTSGSGGASVGGGTGGGNVGPLGADGGVIVTGSGGTTGGTTALGLPCEIQTILQARCTSCHGSQPAGGAQMSLVTLANLTTLSPLYPGTSYAQRALVRMQAAVGPMPPAPLVRATTTEIQTFSNWVGAGSRAGVVCGGTVVSGTGGSTVVTGSGGRAGTGGAIGSTGTGGTGGTAVVASGFPCDVQAMLQNKCVSCHGATLAGGATMSLMTVADLTAMSASDPTLSIAQRALIRIQATVGQMPPAPAVRATTTEIQALSTWIAARYPAGTCTVTPTGTGGASTGTGGAVGTGTGTGGASGTGGAPGGTAAGLPCDVQAVFQGHCTTCHGTSLAGGATMSLVTYANLTTRSPTFTTLTYAQRAVTRMQDNAMPMPPAPGTRVAAGEIQTITNWIAAGYPTGTCGATGAGGAGGGTPTPDPFAARPVCTSNMFWTQGNTGSVNMNPGRACINCHTSGGGGGGDDDEGGDDGEDAPRFTIAGTLYPTAHEPDLCNGVNGGTTGARVVIVDAANRTTTLTPNAAGNFTTTAAITLPFHAKVTYQGRERIMTAAQTSGDCNGCHTQNGANGAPGRILLP